LKEGGSITFSFNLHFPLEAKFHLPPLTYVLVKLAKVSMKKGSIFFFKGISKVGGVIFGIVEVPIALKTMGNMPITDQVLPKYNVIGLGVTPDVQEIGELINGTME
jgi:hypothetical protein